MRPARAAVASVALATMWLTVPAVAAFADTADPAEDLRALAHMDTCTAQDGSWTARGQATNPGDTDIELLVDVFYSDGDGSVVGRERAIVKAGAGQTVDWSTSFVSDANPVRCSIGAVSSQEPGGSAGATDGAEDTADGGIEPWRLAAMVAAGVVFLIACGCIGAELVRLRRAKAEVATEPEGTTGESTAPLEAIAAGPEAEPTSGPEPAEDRATPAAEPAPAEAAPVDGVVSPEEPTPTEAPVASAVEPGAAAERETPAAVPTTPEEEDEGFSLDDLFAEDELFGGSADEVAAQQVVSGPAPAAAEALATDEDDWLSGLFGGDEEPVGTTTAPTSTTASEPVAGADDGSDWLDDLFGDEAGDETPSSDVTDVFGDVVGSQDEGTTGTDDDESWLDDLLAPPAAGTSEE